MDTHRLTVREAWRVLRWFLAVLGLGLALYWGYPQGWWFHGPVEMLGEALMVGAVIASTLELIVSHVLIEKTAGELSEKLVGAGLPSDLQAVIGEIVHRTELVHDQSSIRYSDIREAEESGLVVISVERRYRAWNYGRGVMAYQPTIGDEVFNRTRYLSLQCFLGHNIAYSMNESELLASQKVVPESQARNVYGHPINLDPYRVDQAATYRPCSVIWTYTITVPRNYSDVIAFAASTVGGFEITRGEIPADFEFDATRDTNMAFAEGGTIWRYNRAFLRKHHLRVWWRPKG